MQQIALPLAYVMAFLAVTVLAQGILGAVMANQAKTKRVNRRLTLLESGLDRKEVYETLVRRASTPNFKNANFLQMYERAALFVSQAGMTVSPIVLVGAAIGLALVLWIGVTLLMRAFGNPPGLLEMMLSLVGASLLSGMGTWSFVSMKRDRRLKLIEEQLPLALDILIRGLRAGHPVTSAMQLVTKEMGDPIGSDFGIIVDETSYGFEFTQALTNFARRTGSEDAHFFAVSVAIQAETGGNLSEILNNLAGVIRSRITLGKRVKSLSSEGRMSGIILSGLPIFLVSSIMMSSPSFYTTKFDDPVFWPVVTGILCLYVFGLYLMHRITNFKY